MSFSGGASGCSVARVTSGEGDARLQVLDEARANDLRETMGRRIRAARRALDLTQGQLAEAHGKTYGWLSSIEAGKAFPPPFLIWALRQATGWPYGYFFGEGDELSRPPADR